MLSRPSLLTFSANTLRISALLVLFLTMLTHNSDQIGSLLPVVQVTGQSVTTNCQSIQVPAITHGFEKTEALPSGDHFLLDDALTLAVTAPAPVNGSIPGFNTFSVTPASFGGDVVSVGGLPGTNPTGFSYSTPGGRLTLLSCTDSIWDLNFFIASKGVTAGDVIRFFVQHPDGSGGLTLVTFAVETEGVRLTQLHEQGALYQGSRLAISGRSFPGDFFPFVADAGEAGRRTNLLTLAFEMRPDSPLNGCLQLGVTIMRGNGIGTISVLITDVVVNRKEVAGDVARTTPGLIGGLTSGYPTGRECQVICPKCEEPPTKCDTFCFRSPKYWLNRSRFWPRGNVFISGVNYNQGVNTKDVDGVSMALRGGTPVIYGPLTPREWFNQEYVAAQLNLLAASNAGSVSSINMLWSNLSCYGLNFPPLTLSNGAVLTPNAMMKDLFMQAQQAAANNNAADFNALAGLFNLLNGDNPQGLCN